MTAERKAALSKAGKKGGYMRGLTLSAKRLSAIGRKGAAARWAKARQKVER